MIFLNSDLKNKSIFSLELGDDVAMVDEAIISPADLKIVAFKVRGPELKYQAVVFTDDIREVHPEGFVVDGMKNIVPFDANLIRLQQVLKLNFDIYKLIVENGDGKKIGSISEYAFSSDDFQINRLYIKPKGLKDKLIDKTIVAARGQIVKLSNKRIILSI